MKVAKYILYYPNVDYNKNEIFAENSTNEKKIETWITQQRYNSAEVEISNLDIAANIVINFKNPKISQDCRDDKRCR